MRIQVDRLKDDSAEHLEGLAVEELRTKYQNLDRQYAMLNKELASMQTVCKKYSSLASQKVDDINALEEKAQRLAAEKSKADQKYLASTSAACRKAEAEIESLKSTLSDTKKSLENWKTKSLGNSSSEYEMLRVRFLCTG